MISAQLTGTAPWRVGWRDPGYGLSAFAFTDPDLTAPAAKRMQKYHVNELRTALDAARAQLALPAVTYTNNPAATGVPIAGAHITQLRGGVK